MRRFAFMLVLVASSCARTNTPADVPANEPPLTARVPLHCQVSGPEGIAEGASAPHRVKGGPEVLLSESTLVRLHNRGIQKLQVVARFCLDARGTLTCLDLGQNPEPRDVAQTIVNAVQDWQWDPYLFNGQAQAICSTQGFNYKIQ